MSAPPSFFLVPHSLLPVNFIFHFKQSRGAVCLFFFNINSFLPSLSCSVFIYSNYFCVYFLTYLNCFTIFFKVTGKTKILATITIDKHPLLWPNFRDRDELKKEKKNLNNSTCPLDYTRPRQQTSLDCSALMKENAVYLNLLLKVFSRLVCFCLLLFVCLFWGWGGGGGCRFSILLYHLFSSFFFRAPKPSDCCKMLGAQLGILLSPSRSFSLFHSEL